MKNYPPAVSIIMNCYNGQEFLVEAISSVINQTYQNWEIIFWDNQSTDESAVIANSFNDSRIKYFYASQHTTLSAARNLAISKSKSEWISFLDCDDIWLPDKLEKQFKLVSTRLNAYKKPAGLVYGRSLLIEQNNKNESDLLPQFKNKSLPEGDIFKQLLLEGDFIPLPTVMLKREAFEQIGGIPEEYTCAEDYYFLAAICEHYSALAVQDFIAKYRSHANNLTHTTKEELFREPLAILEKWGHHITPAELAKRKREYHTLLGIQYLFQKKISSAVKEIFIKGSPSFLISKTVRRIQRYLSIV